MPHEVGWYPPTRTDRTGPAATPANVAAQVRPTPRMRVFVLNANFGVSLQKVSVTPKITGPSIIKGFGFWNSGNTWEFAAGTQIYISTDDNTGAENQALGTAITGTLIWELLKNRNTAAPVAPGLILGHLDQIATAASRIISPYEFPLDYLVTLPEFFIKVNHTRSADVVEGYIRVLEGADASFF